MTLYESFVEDAALVWFADLGYGDRSRAAYRTRRTGGGAGFVR